MRKTKKIVLTKKFLREEYWDKQKSLYMIEKETGINRKIILFKMKKFKIQRRTKKEGEKLRDVRLKVNKEKDKDIFIELGNSTYLRLGNELKRNYHISVNLIKDYCKLVLTTSRTCIFLNEEPSDKVPGHYNVVEIRSNDIDNRIRKIAEKVSNIIESGQQQNYIFIEV